MELTGDQLLYLFLGQLIFGAILVVSIMFALKDKTLQMIEGPNGQLLLKIITIFFVCTITGNLALIKIFDASAAAAIFGGVLGYVFGAVAQNGTGAMPTDSQVTKTD